MYLMFLFMGLNMFTWWWLWLSLEILNWILVKLMTDKSSLLFILWQSVVSLSLIYVLISVKVFYFLWMLLLMKMSLPPFHWILFTLMMKMNLKSFLIFISIHKILPMMLVSMMNKEFYFFFFFNLLSLMSFWGGTNSKMFLLMMSTSDSGWMMLSWLSSQMMFLIYVSLFSMLMAMIYFMFKSLNFSSEMMLIYMMIMGMPPFVIFNLKLIMMAVLNMVLGYFMISLTWLNLILIWLWMYSSSLFKSLNIIKFSKINMLIFLNLMMFNFQ